MVKNLFTLVVSVLVLCSCAASQADLFDRAVNEAAVATEKDICTDLIPIRSNNPDLIRHPDNQRILVVMWKSRDSFDRFYKGRTHTDLSEASVTWVTTVPQVQHFGRAYLDGHPGADKASLALRLKQYLGLKPQWQYDVFVEMWVDPDEMFRPCVDPEISDTTCNLNFSDPPVRVRGIDCYPCFYKNLYFQDFRRRPGIPWTGLGYTYDWGGTGSPVGASEFILVPGATYEIHRVVETWNYIRERP